MAPSVGFIGLGNVGAELAGSLLRNGVALTVRDLDRTTAQSFLMDLVVKDMSLFQSVAERAGVPLELSPPILDIFGEAQERYGPREWSPNVIRRLEERAGLNIGAPGFPAELHDDEPEEPGYEVHSEHL